MTHARAAAKTRAAMARMSQPHPPAPLGSQIRYRIVAIRKNRPMKTKTHATQQVQSPPQKLHSGQVDVLPPPGVAVALGVAVLLGVAVFPGVGVFPPHWFGVIV